MSYFKNQEHFQNMLNKVIRENEEYIDDSQLLSLEMYYELNDLDLLDQFSWDIKSNPTLLHEDNYLNWRKINSLPPKIYANFIDKTLTKDFLDKAEEIKDLPGIYSFYNQSEICLYVGVSIRLGERVIQSYTERFRNYKKKIYFKYFTTKSCSDANVLESFAIAKLKPVYNVTGKYDDELTIDFKLPKFSYKILCNEEEE